MTILGHYYDFGKIPDYNKAMIYYKKALALRQKLLPEMHPDTANSYDDLATMYYFTGVYEKAKTAL